MAKPKAKPKSKISALLCLAIFLMIVIVSLLSLTVNWPILKTGVSNPPSQGSFGGMGVNNNGGITITVGGGAGINSKSGLSANPNPPTLSNASIDYGQISVANTEISHGSGSPYQGEWSLIPNFTITNNITESGNPQTIAFSPDGTLAYVVNWCPGFKCQYTGVSVINVPSETETNFIPLGPSADNPSSVAVSPDGTLAYVVNQQAIGTQGTVSVIDTSDDEITNNITVGYSPYKVMFNGDGTLAYVLNVCSDQSCSIPHGNVSIIDTNPVCTRGLGQCIDPAGSTVINNITVGDLPNSFAFLPDSPLIYVVNRCSDASCNNPNGNITIIDTSINEAIRNFTVGVNPIGITFSPDGSYAYVLNACSDAGCNNPNGNVSVIRTATDRIITNITVGVSPFSITINPSGSLLYVVNQCSDLGCSNTMGNVTVIDAATNQVIENITVGNQPTGIATNPEGDSAYVLNGYASTPDSGNVSVLNTPDPILETAYQNLPVNDTGVSHMQAVISAPDSHSLSMDFNGTAYSGTFDDAVNGNYVLYGSVQDSDGTMLTFSNPLTINDTVLPSTLSTSTTSTIPTTSTTSITSSTTESTSSSTLSTTTANTTEPTTTENTTAPTTVGGGQGGFGGGGGGSGTNQPTTIPITVPTTVPEINVSDYNTTIINVTGNLTGQQLCGNETGKSFTVAFGHLGSSFKVIPSGSSCFLLNAENVTQSTNTTSQLPNLTKIVVLNISASTGNVSINAAVSYPCSTPPSRIAPYVLQNGTWSKLNTFNVNAAACTVAFTLPGNPVVGLFESSPGNSTPAPVTTIPRQPHMPSTLSYVVASAILAITVATIFFMLFFRHGGKGFTPKKGKLVNAQKGKPTKPKSTRRQGKRATK